MSTTGLIVFSTEKTGWMPGWPGPWWVWLVASIVGLFFSLTFIAAMIEPEAMGFFGFSGFLVGFGLMAAFITTELFLAAFICMLVGAATIAIVAASDEG